MSHRRRAQPFEGNAPSTVDTTVSQRSSPLLSTARSHSINSSRRPTALREPQLQTPSTYPAKTAYNRPSALPRSISGSSSSRLEAIASSRPMPISSRTRGPSGHRRSPSEDVPLMFDVPPRPESIAPNSQYQDDDGAQSSALDESNDTVLGIVIPDKTERHRHQILPPQLIPELQALANQPSRNRHPAPSVSTISSPSTRFTESPAPWSASTTTTTPVSWSSTSPGLISSGAARMAKSKSQTVPQPAITRKQMPPLPRPQEISRPTTSTSTTKSSKSDVGRGARRKKGSILESPAPSPPPRTSSSQRRAKQSGGLSAPGSIDETLSRAGPSVTPISETDPSPEIDRTRNGIGTPGNTIARIGAGTAHQHLQHSLQRPPTRPSRKGTPDLGESRHLFVNDHRSEIGNRKGQMLAPAFGQTGADLASQDITSVGQTEERLPRIQRSPSRLGKLSRLGLFGRRTNTSSSDVEKSPKKLVRRGPSAGTGHEGYGKYARKARKSSTETSSGQSDSEQSIASSAHVPASSRKHSSSTSRRNRSSQSDVDDFAATRLKPVVIRGGFRPSTEGEEVGDTSQARGASSDVSSRPEQRRLRSPLKDVSNVRGGTIARHEPVSPLALRRSQRFAMSADTFSLPGPIRTDGSAAQPLISSYDTTQSSIVPSSLATSNPASELSSSNVTESQLQEKRPRRRWWNPFKSKTITTPPAIARSVRPLEPEMAVSIAAGPAPRSVPYYAVMESDSENNGPEQIGDLLSEVAESRSRTPEMNIVEDDRPPILRNTDSVLLPAAPVWIHPESNTTSQDPRDLSGAQAPPVKQSRLAHVGRIPKVVPRSEREHKPSRRSFSQPFSRQDDGERYFTPARLDQQQRSDRPQLEIHTDVLPSRPFPPVDYLSAKPASAPARADVAHLGPAVGENTDLVRFPSRHESDVSVSSSSEGKLSIMGPALVPNQLNLNSGRMYPKTRQPSMLAGDEDVWREYDDFIDQVMSPSDSPPRKPARLPVPKVTSAKEVVRLKQPKSSRTPLPEPRRAMLDVTLPTSLTPPVIFPSPSLLSDKTIGEDIRLRRSRIVSALHSSIDPSSPFSMREFLQDYGSVTRDSLRLSDRLSTSTTDMIQRDTPTMVTYLDRTTQHQHSHQDNALLIDTVQRGKDPVKQSELHYASLEVARWLSFGRVLFSPAHKEIHTIPERRVLVIDGLGNEDWAMYCAVTYEAERAIIYDLKEASHHRSAPQDDSFSSLPPNYRRKETSSLSDRFPFHSSYFSAIVLRFPPVMAETTTRNIIAECRRTLVPGGHLEIMLLDLDIVNMGVQTRRAVRELKMRITTKSPNTSLKPAIDNIQTLLGSRGFCGLNRCVVGVPVAGRPNGSTDSSSSSRSSHGSLGFPHRISGEAAQARGHAAKSPADGGSHNFSLNDLVADHSETADAKIGRMVSRTARSWWQRCFEASVLPDGDLSRSVFSDRKVLSECKSRASSFKLLIAYAQRPVFETRRRTMSEPNSSIPATTGPQRQNKTPV